MSDNGKSGDLRPATRLARAGRRPEWTGAAVNPPVWRASTLLFDTVAELEAAQPVHGEWQYGRNGTPTMWAFAEALTELEPGAATTRLFPSGAAAVAAALMMLVEAGDEILVVDSAYSPTRVLCDTLLKRLAVRTIYYDPLIGAGIADLFTDKTRAVFLESPGSLTFEVQDVPAICAAARARGIVSIIDNTWATPLMFPAIERGCDVSVLACTKYIGGHSDVMLGSVTVRPGLVKRLDKTTKALGQTVGPEEAWLALRGLRTLDIRLQRHGENGLRIAQWLSGQPQVARVLHPALPSCPGHEHFLRDFAGASGVFAFELRGGDAAARDRLIESLALFGIGWSWGGFESLAVPSDAGGRTLGGDAAGPAIRLSIGLEDADDLIDDLAAALAAWPSA